MGADPQSLGKFTRKAPLTHFRGCPKTISPTSVVAPLAHRVVPCMNRRHDLLMLSFSLDLWGLRGVETATICYKSLEALEYSLSRTSTIEYSSLFGASKAVTKTNYNQ